ncbi:MAG: transposase [Candidatus Competibacter sp.]|nr:transposase [Candidatus Competibacter sp.]
MTAEEQAWGHWLLVRQSLENPVDLAYSVAFAPRQGTALETLIHVAGRRWSIEVGFEAAKQECGLDGHEVRTWTAWHRHITLALLAHALRVALSAQAKKEGPDRA